MLPSFAIPLFLLFQITDMSTTFQTQVELFKTLLYGDKFDLQGVEGFDEFVTLTLHVFPFEAGGVRRHWLMFCRKQSESLPLSVLGLRVFATTYPTEGYNKSAQSLLNSHAVEERPRSDGIGVGVGGRAGLAGDTRRPLRET